jgi:hypothetical protein
LAAFCFQDFIGTDPAILAFFSSGNSVGLLFQKSKPVQVLEIKPDPDMVRVIGRVAGFGVKREATGNHRTIAACKGYSTGFSSVSGYINW